MPAKKLYNFDEKLDKQIELLVYHSEHLRALDAKIGNTSGYTEFEPNGTMVAMGNAKTYKDVFFPMGSPKTTEAGNPTLVTWNGNLRGYSFSVNDVHDFDPQEFPHDGEENSTATIHIHWVSRTNVAAIRAVKFEVEFSLEPDTGAYPAPTVASAEFIIPANTPANTPYRSDITTKIMGKIARQMYMRLKRIASTGTAPADDPIITGIHYHYVVDTMGSRDITTK